MISNLAETLVFGLLFIFGRELHRVKYLLREKTQQEQSFFRKNFDKISLVLNYVLIILTLIAHTLIPIKNFFKDTAFSVILFRSAASLILLVDTILYVYLISGMHFFIMRTKNHRRNLVLIYSVIAI